MSQYRHDYKKRWYEANRERLLAKQREDYRHVRGSYEARLNEFTLRLQTLSDIERGYIAGLVDGEGSISVTRIKQQSHHLGVMVSVCNTDVRMIDWLVERLGGRIKWQYGYDKGGTIRQPKPIARWFACGRMAAALCRVIQPWLHTSKRERADFVIRLFAEQPKRHMTEAEKQRRVAFWEEFKTL